MATCGNHHFCTLCLEDDISNEAVTWCTDCETFMCFNCERHHKRNKASKEHRVVSVEEYDNLPSFILKTSNRCADHDKRYELYCRFHENACCVECIDDKHKECRDLSPLSGVLGNIKSSAGMSQLEGDLNCIQENFEEIEKVLSSNMSTLENQNEKGFAEIQSFRKLINDHLDKLEKEIRDKLSTEYSKLKSNREGLMREVERRKKHIGHLQEDFVKMITFATDLQTFVGSKTIEEMKTKETKYIEDLKSVGNLDTIYLKVNMSSVLNSFVDAVSSFGDVSVQSTPSILKLKQIREQIPVNKVADISQIKPKLIKTIKIPTKSPGITGCQILPDGKMLFVDRDNMRLMLFHIRDVVTFSSQPFKVCYIADNMVAVTLFKEKAVKVIDLAKNKITNSFSTMDVCFGIDCDQRSIYVTTETNSRKSDLLSIDLINKQVNKTNTLDAIATSVACFENKIYFAYFIKNRVACHRSDGELLWTYEHEDIDEPRSLSVDRQGFVYVSCRTNRKIVVLTPDGKESRVILSLEDGLREPFTVNIDKKMSKLLVGNQHDGNAFLFQI